MSRDYQRIATLINYLVEHPAENPSLETLAELVHLSPFHLQKLFTRWAGVTPKQFIQAVKLENAKSLLLDHHNILETTNTLGLTSSSRLYDCFVTIDAVTPGEFKSKGQDLVFQYGTSESLFGNIFVAWTSRGIHSLQFIDASSAKIDTPVNQLKTNWPLAKFEANPSKANEIIASVFTPGEFKTGKKTVSLWVKGTNFQVNVWRALLAIPEGKLTSYGELAKFLGKPKSAQAVGQAVGANPVALLIPCHRVIQQAGGVSGYRWGVTRKLSILSAELCSAGGVSGRY